MTELEGATVSRVETLRALVMGIFLGIILILPYSGGYLAGTIAGALGVFVLIIILLLVAGGAVNRESFKSVFSSFKQPLGAYLLILIAIKIAHDSFSMWFGVGAQVAGQNILWSFIFVFTGLAVLGFPLQSYILRLAVMAIAFCVYLLVNVIGYHLNLAPHIATMGSIKTIDGSSLSERMIAPFGPGLNNFGVLSVMGAQITIICAWAAFLRRNIFILTIMMLCLLVSLYSIYLVQIRSGLIGILFGLLFISIPWNWKRRFFIIAAFGLLALPAAFINLTALKWLNEIVPVELESQMSRNNDEFLVLGGRAYIYDYGWSQLFNGEIGLIGDGVINRDSGPVAFEFAPGADGGGVSFHNGALETLVVYGPLLGFFILGILISPLCIKYPGGNPSFRLAKVGSFGVLGALCVCAYFESFFSMWHFLMLLIVGVVTLCEIRKMEHVLYKTL